MYCCTSPANGVQPPAAAPSPFVNPATEEVIGTLPHASIADLDEALAAAAAGFAVWRKISAYERSKIMRKAADFIRERAEFIARLMTIEQGKPLVEARTEILGSADVIDGRRGRPPRLRLRHPRARLGHLPAPAARTRPPHAFTPRNFPMSHAVRIFPLPWRPAARLS